MSDVDQLLGESKEMSEEEAKAFLQSKSKAPETALTAFQLGRFCYRFYSEITGLSRDLRDEEGEFPSPIFELAEKADDYDAFQEGWQAASGG